MPSVTGAARAAAHPAAVSIPIELLRTVVTIVEAGSFTKAATRLDISQPGVSAQIKRLQVLVGGPVFDRSVSGVALTDRGKTLLPLAKQILEANDLILHIGGAAGCRAPIRVGVDALYARRIVAAVTGRDAAEATVLCAEPDAIAKGLRDGYLDVGCVAGPTPGTSFVAAWDEELVWTRSRDFVLSPGSPIPLVGLPSLLQDRVATAALRERALAYRHVFVAADPSARLAAVASGIGLMPVTARCPIGDLVVAGEYYLPPLGRIAAGICLRDDKDRRRLTPLLDRLVAAVGPSSR